MSKFAKRVAQNVYNYRKALKMSRCIFAEKVGVSEDTILHIEKGTGNAYFSTLDKICDFLNIDASELLTKPDNFDEDIDHKIKIYSKKMSKLNDKQLDAVISVIDVM